MKEKTYLTINGIIAIILLIFIIPLALVLSPICDFGGLLE